MHFSVINRQIIIIWLSVILLILSVAVSVHSVEHIDEGAKTNCSLCFHLHQLDKVLPQQYANVEISNQKHDLISITQPIVRLTHSVIYLSRAPPFYLYFIN